MAYFYEDTKGRKPTWEEVGGFNVALLSAIRDAANDVRSESQPLPVVSLEAAEWMRRLPSFDFPDDEIG